MLKLVQSLLVLAFLPFTLGAQMMSGGNFEKHILPIFKESCFDCHSDPAKRKGKKPKGELRLDSAKYIMAGSENGSILTPGKPLESTLYKLIILPPEDDDIMPSKGDPLTKDQTELIRKWIASGASFDGWVGEDDGKATSTATAKAYISKPSYLDVIASQLRAISPQTLEKVTASGAHVVPLREGHTLYRVDYLGLQAMIGDAEITELRSISKNITELDLSQTKISDKALSTVVYLENLTRLDLHDTAISDKGMYYLSGLKNLRYLNLYGTKVSNSGVQHLFDLKNLKELHLWKTKVTLPTINYLKRENPGIVIGY